MLSAKKELFTPSGGGYQISRSVRLRSSASAYFNRTPASASNRKTWTWSGWVKRGLLSSGEQVLFSAGSSYTTQTYFTFYIGSDNKLVTSTGSAEIWRTTQVFRDPAAWYHIVLVVDTTQATADNRTRLYVNGTEVTSFTRGTNLSLNTDYGINYNIIHYIGRDFFQPIYFDGYMTEINFIDGQALTPSSFGETNALTGVWQPKRYAGTYGTNGFYLNFSDNSGVTATTIGKDYSGNGNNWTPNNISVTAGTTYDSMLDVPTNYADGGNGRGNYAVLNPLISASYQTLSNANLTSKSNTSTDSGASYSTITTGTTGLWYCEFTANTSAGGGYPIIGTWDTSVALPNGNGGSYLPGASGSATGYMSSGNKYITGSSSAYGSSYSTNDVVGVAIDCTNGAIYFSKNGVFQNSGVPTSGASKTGAANTWTGGTKEFLIGLASFVSGNGADANFGQRPFAYTPPTGFVALNTQNLPDATIKRGNDYFDIVTRTGTGASAAISSYRFAPDFVWIKARTNAYYHKLLDKVRGANKVLASNATDAEITETQGLMSFDANGYTLGTSSDSTVNNSGSGQTYVDWAWNAGGSTVTNTSGNITSSVRANTTAGFSVVTYTGNGLTNQSIGHGLGATPGMVIIKQRSGTASWLVHHQSQPTGYTVYLNLTNAQDAGTSQWGTSPQTSTVFYVGYTAGATGSNVSASTYVAYCFAPVAGYSAFGKYTGNGSADGPFVFTGFRPRFVMTKRTDSTGGWVMLDSARDSYNVSGNILQAESSAAELAVASYPTLDILSNGFKIRSSTIQNASGGTYIFMAVAENPFKLSLAR